jgi:hypothetical protein
MIDTCHAAGVKVIAGMFPSRRYMIGLMYPTDVLFNHMAGIDSGKSFPFFSSILELNQTITRDRNSWKQ